MVNATINATTEAIIEHQGVLGFIDYVWQRVLELLTAPAHHPEMLWMAIPLVFTLFVMQLYFGRYTKEELGWNTAVGNSMVLIFISIDLLRYILVNYEPHTILVYVYEYKKTLIALLVLGQGIALWQANFFHKWPKKIAFFISSPICVNLIAYVALASVYSEVPFNGVTLLAAFVIWLGLYGLFALIHKVQYKPGEERKPKARTIEKAED